LAMRAYAILKGCGLKKAASNCWLIQARILQNVMQDLGPCGWLWTLQRECMDDCRTFQELAH